MAKAEVQSYLRMNNAVSHCYVRYVCMYVRCLQCLVRWWVLSVTLLMFFWLYMWQPCCANIDGIGHCFDLPWAVLFNRQCHHNSIHVTSFRSLRAISIAIDDTSASCSRRFSHCCSCTRAPSRPVVFRVFTETVSRSSADEKTQASVAVAETSSSSVTIALDP